MRHQKKTRYEKYWESLTHEQKEAELLRRLLKPRSWTEKEWCEMTGQERVECVMLGILGLSAIVGIGSLVFMIVTGSRLL